MRWLTTVVDRFLTRTLHEIPAGACVPPDYHCACVNGVGAYCHYLCDGYEVCHTDSSCNFTC